MGVEVARIGRPRSSLPWHHMVIPFGAANGDAAYECKPGPLEVVALPEPTQLPEPRRASPTLSTFICEPNITLREPRLARTHARRSRRPRWP